MGDVDLWVVGWDVIARSGLCSGNLLVELFINGFI